MSNLVVVHLLFNNIYTFYSLINYKLLTTNYNGFTFLRIIL